VLPLGEHRRRERHDRVDGGLCRLRHRFGRLAGPDPGLDVTGAKSTVHLDLQLAEACVVAAERGPEAFVDVDGELDALVADQEQALAVTTQSGEREVGHRACRSSWSGCFSGVSVGVSWWCSG
jgi:hypothetical protein